LNHRFVLNILIAPDSFKDCLPAKAVIDNIRIGIEQVIPEAKIVGIPLSDGGEGLLDSIMAFIDGRLVEVEVKDPLMRNIKARYGIIGDGQTGILEMAQASGLELLSVDERNPLKTTTYGTGQLISHALEAGCKRLIIGIGGSATNDGGAGMLQALGVKLLKANGESLTYGGAGLEQLTTIDSSGIDHRIQACDILVACDVSNPLTGDQGASKVYGPQKGATDQMVSRLDKNLDHFAAAVKEHTGRDVKNMPGAGAAGGIGAAMMAFLNAELKPGFTIVKELVGLEEAVEAADLVISGEGKIDYQTQFGKTPYGVAQIARKFNKPLYAFAGIVGEGIQDFNKFGFTEILRIADPGMDQRESIRRAPELLQQAAVRLMHQVSKGL
jgi:glycerate kinase